MQDRLVPTLRLYSAELIALALFAVAVLRQWPLDDLVVDGTAAIVALFGLVAALWPDELLAWSTGPMFHRRPSTAREAWLSDECQYVRYAGFLVLIDAVTLQFFSGLLSRWLV